MYQYKILLIRATMVSNDQRRRKEIYHAYNYVILELQNFGSCFLITNISQFMSYFQHLISRILYCFRKPGDRIKLQGSTLK